MRKIHILFILSIFVFVAFLLPVVSESIAQASDKNINDQAEEIYNNMDETEKICQTLMIHSHQWNGKDTTTVESDFAQILQKYHFGGFVLFGQNTKTTENTFQFIQDLQKNTMTTHYGQSQAGLPLITTPDQEGGAVFRLYAGTSMLGNMATGATFNTQVAKNSGEIISRELNSLGIDSTLAPCVDVNANAGNPIIGLRSFGDNIKNVGHFGSAFMQVCKANGVLAYLKHFPGHGDVASDTHTGSVISYKNKEELMSSDIVPFKQCMDDGAEAIMTAHITFPNIDNTKLIADKPGHQGEEIIVPATLSKVIMKDILRDELHYDGLACTDAITMNGISNYFTEPSAVTLALDAGNDMIAEAINAENAADFISQADAIIAGVKKWRDVDYKNAARLKDAILRVIKTKIKTGIINYKTSSYSLENAKKTLRNVNSLTTEYTDTAKSITLVKNKDNIIPLKVDEHSKVLYLTQNSTSTTNANRRSDSSFAIAWNRLKANKLIPQNVFPSIFTFKADTTLDQIKPMIDQADYVIVDSGIKFKNLMGYLSWQTKIPNDIINYAHEKGKKSVAISIQLPYDCQLYPNADAILCTYSYVGSTPEYKKVLQNGVTTTVDVCGPNLIEGIEAIFGNINIQGKLPVDIPCFHPETETYDKSDLIYKRGYGLTTNQLININNLKIDFDLNNIDVSRALEWDNLPKVIVKTGDAKVTYSSKNVDNLNIPNKSFTISVARNDRTFVEGKDYVISYNYNRDTRILSASVTGIGDVVGSKTISFEVPDKPGFTAQTGDCNYYILLCIFILVLLSSIFLFIRQNEDMKNYVF